MVKLDCFRESIKGRQAALNGELREIRSTGHPIPLNIHNNSYNLTVDLRYTSNLDANQLPQTKTDLLAARVER